MSTSVSTYNARNTNNIPLLKVKHNFFQNSFCPSVVIEWNKLDLNIPNSYSKLVYLQENTFELHASFWKR